MTVRNEAPRIEAALRSCEDFAAEIVVVDTGSEDDTVRLVLAHPKTRVLIEAFEDFSAAKQAALAACEGDWVLVLDADERVSPELVRKIEALDRNGQLEHAGGYRIRRRNWILGREMSSMGLERDYPLRLVRREGARYNERPVHEAIEVEAGRAVGQLEEPLEHHTFWGVDLYLRKMDLYTSLELLERERRHSNLHMISVWPSTFWRYYIARGGWRDGFAGFVWAALTATGRFLRDMKIFIRAQPYRPRAAEPGNENAPREDDARRETDSTD
jgi:glycosyltransferase involved in cell wall biosynthesis